MSTEQAAAEPKIICSSGAFSREPGLTDHQAIERYGSELDVDGIEVIFYGDWYGKEEPVAEDLDRYGLRYPVLHVEKSIGRLLGSLDKRDRNEAMRRLEANCRLGRQVGAEIAVFHLWGAPDSDQRLEQNLRALTECIDVAADSGLALAIETVPCTRYDPLGNVQRAIERDPRCRVALDTEYLSMHKQLDEALDAPWLWQDQFVVDVHVKDYDGNPVGPDGRRRYLQIGEGQVDFKRLFGALRDHNYTGYVCLEASAVDDEGHVHLDLIKNSLSTMRSLLKSENEDEVTA